MLAAVALKANGALLANMLRCAPEYAGCADSFSSYSDPQHCALTDFVPVHGAYVLLSFDAYGHSVAGPTVAKTGCEQDSRIAELLACVAPVMRGLTCTYLRGRASTGRPGRRRGE